MSVTHTEKMNVEVFTRKNGDGVYGITTHYYGAKIWFRWCYKRKARAEEVAKRLRIDNEQDRYVNWTYDPLECAVSSYEEEQDKRMRSRS